MDTITFAIAGVYRGIRPESRRPFFSLWRSLECTRAPGLRAAEFRPSSAQRSRGRIAMSSLATPRSRRSSMLIRRHLSAWASAT